MSVYLMNQCNEEVMKGTHIHHCDLPTSQQLGVCDIHLIIHLALYLGSNYF